MFAFFEQALLRQRYVTHLPFVQARATKIQWFADTDTGTDTLFYRQQWYELPQMKYQKMKIRCSKIELIHVNKTAHWGGIGMTLIEVKDRLSLFRIDSGAFWGRLSTGGSLGS